MYKYEFSYADHLPQDTNFEALQKELDACPASCEGFQVHDGKVVFIDPESGTFFQETHDALVDCMAAHSNDPYYLAIAREKKCAEIDAFRDRKLADGVPYVGGPVAVEALFEASRVKRTDLNSVISTGKDEQEFLDEEGNGELYTHPWWDIDENQYEFTVEEFKHFRRQLSHFVSPIYGAGKWHKAVVNHVLPSVVDIENYDFSAGWPL